MVATVIVLVTSIIEVIVIVRGHGLAMPQNTVVVTVCHALKSTAVDPSSM